jgi:hypothetical protein
VGDEGFDPDAEYQCRFGASRTPARRVAEKEFTCLTSAWHTAQAVGFALEPEGLSLSASDNVLPFRFHFHEKIHIVSVHPTAGGSAGNTAVTITGTFPQGVRMACRFGDVLQDGAQLVSGLFLSARRQSTLLAPSA